jgi:hypothetical protein
VGYEGTPDHLYEEGGDLPGGLRAIRLAGLWGGDHALLWDAPGGEHVLFSGDVVNGQVHPDLTLAGHYRRPHALNFGNRPGYLERHPDHEALRRSLRRILEEDFDLLCGAHAMPFRDHPKPALADLPSTVL